ncbi:zinc-dependent metalloprotease [Bifidobacterium gallicum]|uniref:Hydrolase n=1 Tax=Bifidobacterium gallicum DSM 20093 = LMG 11596 TaxID=561180 RepID=D1NSP3_9BIFI|nr:zinc-dependent metalloprotease [Bifidobacterium gallicum]EFA23695.1 putative hydrolase [Bifidobacterium gallicum DSM 20093 = LMG 11596]KFI59279.1 hydrolase [Bifidobacterium gallicum DSM 20093 = LMG 11596]
MDENALRQWLIQCFGPIQGEVAWRQLEGLPDYVKEQLLSQDPSTLPDPAQVQSLMKAFSTGGMSTFPNMEQTVQDGAVNVKLAKSLALQQVNAAGSETQVSMVEGQAMRSAMSEANLWLDTASSLDPVQGAAEALTRADWVEGTLDSWANFAAPVAESMNSALTSVIGERLGDLNGEITGMFAGPVPIPIPDGMKDPKQLLKLFANTSFAMQLGQAAGSLALEVRGSYDQGIALLNNAAGGLIMQNVYAYAKELEIDVTEVTAFLALREAAYARLYANVPWLMPRFEALIGKYARGVVIDLDAMEEQLRDVTAMDPQSLSGAVDLTNVGLTDSPEQREAMTSIGALLALVEGWVDTVVWRAGMAHLPHIEQLREMMRRERAMGGPAERTFESLIGLQLRPKRVREAAQLWETITLQQGIEARDGMWAHPDLLPQLPAEPSNDANAETTAKKSEAIDWDAELSQLLEQDEAASHDATDGTAEPSGNESTNDAAEDSGDGSGNTDSGDQDAADPQEDGSQEA